MSNIYYKQKQLIARADKDGNEIGQIDKWQAHREGVLHKGLTVTLVFKGQFIIQHRKHPAFDGSLDLTSSSHQLFVRGRLQTALEAAYDCLKREWNLDRQELIGQPENLGSIYYKARDSKSIYTEHEICDVLIVGVKKIPEPNYDFAYGYSLVGKKDLQNKDSVIYGKLAPWVKKAIEKGLL